MTSENDFRKLDGEIRIVLIYHYIYKTCSYNLALQYTQRMCFATELDIYMETNQDKTKQVTLVICGLK